MEHAITLADLAILRRPNAIAATLHIKEHIPHIHVHAMLDGMTLDQLNASNAAMFVKHALAVQLVAHPVPAQVTVHLPPTHVHVIEVIMTLEVLHALNATLVVTLVQVPAPTVHHAHLLGLDTNLVATVSVKTDTMKLAILLVLLVTIPAQLVIKLKQIVPHVPLLGIDTNQEVLVHVVTPTMTMVQHLSALPVITAVHLAQTVLNVIHVLKASRDILPALQHTAFVEIDTMIQMFKHALYVTIHVIDAQEVLLLNA